MNESTALQPKKNGIVKLPTVTLTSWAEFEEHLLNFGTKKEKHDSKQ